MIAFVRLSGLVFFWLLALPLLAAPPSNQRYVLERYPHNVNSNTLTIRLQAVEESPEWVAVVVRQGDPMAEWRAGQLKAMERWQAEIKTNRNATMPVAPAPPLGRSDRPAHENAVWIPFQTNLVVDLGPGDGERSITFGYRYQGQARCDKWSGSFVTVQTHPAAIAIVNPTNFVTFQPMIQLQGLATHPLNTVRYDRYNERGEKVVSDAMGFAGASNPGDPRLDAGRKFFTCFDVELSPGTNTLVLRCTDEFGNRINTNLAIVFTTKGDITPPTLEPLWPQPGSQVGGGHFVARGHTDDPTAIMHGQIIANGKTNDFNGLVERNGRFWFDDVLLAVGANVVTLTATDAAGNRSCTNFVVYGVDSVAIIINPVDPNKLRERFIQVSGKVTPAHHDVWVNGVPARVKPDGSWTAEQVPTGSPNDSVSSFYVTALPQGQARKPETNPSEMVAVQAGMSTNALVLNSSSPACGVFQLHLSETAGRSFILFASTNLVDWTPILTNLNSAASFDFADDATKHPCRFFKVVPLK